MFFRHSAASRGSPRAPAYSSSTNFMKAIRRGEIIFAGVHLLGWLNTNLQYGPHTTYEAIMTPRKMDDLCSVNRRGRRKKERQKKQTRQDTHVQISSASSVRRFVGPLVVGSFVRSFVHPSVSTSFELILDARLVRPHHYQNSGQQRSKCHKVLQHQLHTRENEQ